MAGAWRFRVQERYGLVWIALEEPRCPLPEVPELETGDWAVVAAGPYRWRCDAARQVENFTGFGHFPWVHPGLLGDPQRPVVPRHQVHADGHVQRYEIVRPEAPNTEDLPVFGNKQAGRPPAKVPAVAARRRAGPAARRRDADRIPRPSDRCRRCHPPGSGAPCSGSPSGRGRRRRRMDDAAGAWRLRRASFPAQRLGVRRVRDGARLLAWIYLGAEITVYAAEINVAAARRLWPRPIVQPPLTQADRGVLAAQVLQTSGGTTSTSKCRMTTTGQPAPRHPIVAAGGDLAWPTARRVGEEPDPAKGRIEPRRTRSHDYLRNGQRHR